MGRAIHTHIVAASRCYLVALEHAPVFAIGHRYAHRYRQGDLLVFQEQFTHPPIEKPLQALRAIQRVELEEGSPYALLHLRQLVDGEAAP